MISSYPPSPPQRGRPAGAQERFGEGVGLG